jgi:hypothetical protein
MKTIFKATVRDNHDYFSLQENAVQIGDITIRDVHEQDCCENVYADWSVMQYYEKEIKKFPTQEIKIKGVRDMGLLLIISGENSVKVFIPCYNMQNGYYSDKLALKITYTEDNEIKTKTFDITNYKEDDIH